MPRFDSNVLILWSRGMARGFITVRRERGWWTTLGALVGVMLVLQLLLTGAVVARGFEQLLVSRMELRVGLKSTAQDSDIQGLFAAIKSLPYVSSVSYVTKEQMYEQERLQDPNLISFLEQFKLSNPFQDAMVVTVQSPDNSETFSEFLRTGSWSSIIDPTFLSTASVQERETGEMLRLTQDAQLLLSAFLVLLLGVLLFVLIELVRRRAIGRREEVLVERLAGAQELSILIPFATEGMILLAVAVLLSGVIMASVLAVLPVCFPTLFHGTLAPLVEQVTMLLPSAIPLVLCLEVVAIPFVAFAGAWVALRPLLRSPRIALTA